MLKQHRKLKTFGKTAKINIEERTSKFLYWTEVNNVSWKCIPYIYYTENDFVQQLTRFQLTLSVARSLCGSWTSSFIYVTLLSSYVFHFYFAGIFVCFRKVTKTATAHCKFRGPVCLQQNMTVTITLTLRARMWLIFTARAMLALQALY